MSQNVISGSCEFGSARNFTAEVNAWKSWPITRPESTSTRMFPTRRASTDESPQLAATAITPQAKALISIPRPPKESRMPTAAPKQAPADAPRRSGDTMGFLNMPWYAQPAADSAVPTSSAASTRGRRSVKSTPAWRIASSAAGASGLARAATAAATLPKSTS